MKRARAVLLVVSVVLAMIGLATACSEGSSHGIEATQADNGSILEMDVGQQLRITLEANPTTGYQWAIEGDLPMQLEQAGEPEFTAESDAIGAGGSEVWSFEVVSTGEGTLRLKYWRSFEPEVDPIETFEVSVSVK
ncbi:MAG: protease inhibitor I42 family protein [Anaerosomatales bacterium]|nr:protease inhibitor I42 family protein [Anaerosomatales bacterium]MDT8433808.1 protease inhibitor I42 family protein [Anaerosomatales bacterium]